MSATASTVISAYGTVHLLNGEIGVFAMKPKPCKTCNSPFHAAWYHKPRKPLVTTTRLNQVGKQGKKTAAAVAKWKRTIKPNHQGYYECYICHKWVEYNMAEHVKSKTHRPDLRTEASNFKTVCGPCNEKKGSADN